jgi:hypothetical protein
VSHALAPCAESDRSDERSEVIGGAAPSGPMTLAGDTVSPLVRIERSLSVINLLCPRVW